ncbi:carbohydrate-binding module family 20 domain-containing protein [Bacteroides nordii]|uniref:carbohydrate-binding module family 20 domain-containing protein n=1 Tax=Bacteroides nordii TaxID=291645 RepID=UPI0024321DBC|nr:carbohydrate-binding module family 20 domain-containing protein [Bacteroides nordii]
MSDQGICSTHQQQDYCLAICGNQKALGDWDPDKAWPMSDANFPGMAGRDWMQPNWNSRWNTNSYLYNKEEKRAEAWENNPNRYLAAPGIESERDAWSSADRYAYFNIPAWKGAGVAVPCILAKVGKELSA